MKTFTKLSLVSAMAFSGSAMAMQVLDDDALSAATGQDGITISLGSKISMDYLAIVDKDGAPSDISGIATNLGAGGTANTTTGLSTKSGAIVIGGKAGSTTPGAFSITPTDPIKLIIDADGNATGGTTSNPVLNIQAKLGTTSIAIGSIGVARIDDLAKAAGSSLKNRVDVLDIGTITLNDLTANIQLGSQPQGAMIKLNSTITGGLKISDLSLKGTNGDIGLGTVGVTSAGTNDLSLKLNIDPTATGLNISGLTNLDVSASNLRLGNASAASLGAMYVKNLDVGTGLVISGH